MKRLAVLVALASTTPAIQADVIRIYPSDALTLQLDLTKPVTDPAYFTPHLPAGSGVHVAGQYPWSIYRGLLKFDLGVIPDGSLVTDAQLHMTVQATFPTQESDIQVAERMTFDGWDDSAIDQSGYVASTHTQLGAAARLLEQNNTVTWNLSIVDWDLATDLADNAVTMQVRYLQEGDYSYKGTGYYSHFAGWPQEQWPYLQLTVVPEPTSLALLAFGVVAALRHRHGS